MQKVLFQQFYLKIKGTKSIQKFILFILLETICGTDRHHRDLPASATFSDFIANGEDSSMIDVSSLTGYFANIFLLLIFKAKMSK